MSRATARLCVVLLGWACTGCRCDRGQPTEPEPAAASVGAASSSGAEPAGHADAWPELAWYGWIKDSSYPVPEPVDTVLRRFSRALPPGYGGTPAELGTWEEWLRLLPLAAPGTPVKNYRGEIVVPGDDEHLGAVVAIDLGRGDTQHSADAILRLYAEWRWSKEDFRMLFLSDAKLELPFQRWLGDAAEPKPSRAAFREYLDQVLASSGGRALLAESAPLAPNDLAPGAFFLRPGHPAEALLVLDVGTSPAGERVMLLARALNPAESVHVIRPSRNTAWFPVRTDQPVSAPRSGPFSWRDLRRMKRLWSPPEVPCVGSLCPKTAASRTPGRDAIAPTGLATQGH
jgi:hypothetical protein